jgi:hypothetical protein
MADTNETPEQKQEQQPQATEQPQAAPELSPEEKDGFRRQLSEMAARNKQLEQQLELRQAEEKKRETEELEKKAEFEKLYKDTQAELSTLRNENKRSALENKLLAAGVTDELKRAGLMASYNYETDPDAHIATLKEQYPSAFEQEAPKPRNAGAHGAPVAGPGNHDADILKLWNSGNNDDVNKALALAQQKAKAGTLSESTMKELGLI